jgi:DNA-directed RNA polymerase I, II, and III subunit RPABC2
MQGSRFLQENHPEVFQHNYDEIAKLSVITRDEEGNIVDPLHRTHPFLTKYERARVLGQRTKQIEHGAKPLIKIDDSLLDAYLIAELELEAKKIPFILRRPLPDGSFEYWKLKDLVLL